MMEYTSLLVGFVIGSVVTWLLVFMFQLTKMESDMRAEDRQELERLRSHEAEKRVLKHSTRTMWGN